MTDPLHNSSKTPRVAERPNLVVVVHPSVPGPLSADPRNRQIFRRLLDLRELGFEVTLVPIELLPGGGAPNELRDAGIQIEHVLDEPLTRRLQHLNRSGDSSPSPGIYITTINLARSHRDALALWSGPIVVDLDHLGSDERKFGRRAFRESEQPGIDTELAHLIEIEAGILACADLVITVDPAGRDRLQEAHGATASHVAVVPPSLQHTTAKSDAESSGLVLIPARFSSEWGTPGWPGSGVIPR